MNTIRYGLTNTLNTGNAVGRRIRDILNDAAFRGALGFGSNAVAKINGSVVSPDHIVVAGQVIDIETKAQEKANDNVVIRLRYGLTNTLDVSVPTGTTVDQVLANTAYKAALGYGNGCVAKVNGAVVNNGLRVAAGMTIDIETKAQEKAL
jgi:sulfur carrier protein ThiS